MICRLICPFVVCIWHKQAFVTFVALMYKDSCNFSNNFIIWQKNKAKQKILYRFLLFISFQTMLLTRQSALLLYFGDNLMPFVNEKLSINTCTYTITQCAKFTIVTLIDVTCLINVPSHFLCGERWKNGFRVISAHNQITKSAHVKIGP